MSNIMVSSVLPSCLVPTSGVYVQHMHIGIIQYAYVFMCIVEETDHLNTA
jgi:hypothetical protein